MTLSYVVQCDAWCIIGSVVTSCIIHQKWYRNDVLVRYFSALISFAVYLYMCEWNCLVLCLCVLHVQTLCGQTLRKWKAGPLAQEVQATSLGRGSLTR